MRVSTREFPLGDYQVPASQTFLLPLRELAAHDPCWEGKTGEPEEGLLARLLHVSWPSG